MGLKKELAPDTSSGEARILGNHPALANMESTLQNGNGEDYDDEWVRSDIKMCIIGNNNNIDNSILHIPHNCLHVCAHSTSFKNQYLQHLEMLMSCGAK